MNLFIHYGIYKTGSSFLQTNAARNRELLLKEGYYFPESIREQDMVAGRISPGNGNGLALFIKHGQRDKIRWVVSNWIREAKAKKCQKILISDEALIHGFAIASSLQLFYDVLNELGIHKTYCLGFFRDPVDHCLSTLKHRAKKGTIPDFEDWILKKYETYDVIEQFLNNYKKVPFEWDFQVYQSNGSLMADFFFNHWLKITQIPPYSNIIVNPSLSLSELSILYSIRSVDSRLIKYVYNGFLNVKTTDKANDKDLNLFYRIIAQKKLNQHHDTISALNSVFKDHVFSSENAVDVKSYPKPDLHFNELQIYTLSKSIKLAYQPYNYLKDTLLKIFRIIKK